MQHQPTEEDVRHVLVGRSVSVLELLQRLVSSGLCVLDLLIVVTITGANPGAVRTHFTDSF